MESNTEVVEIDQKYRGLVIGKKGQTIRDIRIQSGVSDIRVKDDGVHLRGTQQQIAKAKQMISSIIIFQKKQEERHSWQEKDIAFPAGLAGLLIGRGGNTIRKIQDETGTEVKIDEKNNVAHIRGPTQQHIQDAEKRVNDLISENKAERKAHSRQYQHRPEKFALVDSTCVGEDNDFELQEVKTNNPDKILYKLVMKGEKCEEKEMDYISELKEVLLKVLREIRKEVSDTGNIRTDMWCHFGHARIHSVDEADAGKNFELNDINQNLQEAERNSPWKVHFEAGVEKLEYEALEKELRKREQRVKPNTRFDYTFISPTKHPIRFKAFVPDSNEEEGLFSFQDDIIPIKNTLADQSSDYKYRLCAPSTTRLKVDIFIPYLTFDCHLVLRTTMREVKDVTKQEENQILIDFLDKNLKYENKDIKLPLDELPDGFSVVYSRQAKRRSYPYSIDDSEFNVMITEEEFQEQSHDRRSLQDKVQTKTDIHVHCDEWDDLLDQEDWEPEAIVSKLPNFLRFLRAIQQNVNVTVPENDE